MEERYQQAFVREVTGTSKGKKVRKGWQMVLKYKQPNPQFLEKPKSGEDTRKPAEKRRDIWKQLTKMSSARTKSAATKELQEWRGEMETKAQEPDYGKVTLVDYIAAYIDRREAAQIIEKSTATDYHHPAQRIEKGFSDVPMVDVTDEQVTDWETAELRRGVSATTVGKAHRLLKQVYSYAFKHKAVKSNIMDLVEPPKRPRKEPNGLTVEESQRVTALLLAMGPTPVATAAFLALHAGLRAGECCGLMWSDVDLMDGSIRVRHSVGLASGGAYIKGAKTDGSTRTVFIDNDTVGVLASRMEEMRGQLRAASVVMSDARFSELFVCGTIEGAFLNPQILSRKWSAIAEASRIIGTEGKRATFHTLRHAYATVAIAANPNEEDVKSISKQMGHSTVGLTLDTYASALDAGKRRIAASVGDAMRPTDAPSGEVVRLSPTGTEN